MCEKIQDNCPFIEKISLKILWRNDFLETQIKQKKEKLKKIQKELEQMKKSRKKLADYRKEKKVNEMLKKIDAYYEKEQKYNILVQKMQDEQEKIWKKAKLSGQEEEMKKQIWNIEEKITSLQKEINDWKKHILDKKQLEQDYKLYLQESKKLEIENKKLTELNDELLKLENKEKQLNELTWTLKEVEKQLLNIKKDLEKLGKEKDNLKSVLQDINIEKIRKNEKIILDLKELVGALNSLLEDYQKNKICIIELKKKYSLLKDLSNIFGKELVIYVFSDYISSLESLINYFIADIVNFKLNIRLDEKWENLDIFVEDEKWIRQISSLSWGQKTALRIGWILGINKLQNSKLLFLDETIHNFDQESVQLIANKIKEFTEENDIKFYMITHSDILQQSDIWTEIVELQI